MKTPPLNNPHRSLGIAARSRRRPPAAFTLVELLVVIAIIGILAGLITGAAIVARAKGRQAVIVTELKTGLEAGCMEYKNQHGDYPPDCCGLQSGIYGDTIRDATRQVIIRHLAAAFPMYQPGTPSGAAGTLTPWDKLRLDVLGNLTAATPYEGWGIDINYLSPSSALTFFLGGKPDWFRRSSNNTPIQPGDSDFNATKPFRGFLGFSADPTNPFGAGAGRVKFIFDFDLTRVAVNSTTGVMAYWPRSGSDPTSGCIMYFRAENSGYSWPGMTCSKFLPDPYYVADNTEHIVFPAVDYRRCIVNGTTVQYTWINPRTFQIFSSGLEGQYTTPAVDMTFYPTSPASPLTSYPSDFPTTPIPFAVNNQGRGPYQYPDGANYSGSTYKNITNFSGNTLDAAMP